MKTTRTILTLTVVTILACPALADWDEWQPHKMHFPQLPDLSSEGMDVLAGPISRYDGAIFYEKFLADDWVCSETGYVTDIHIWGSNNEDLHLMHDPTFSLVIYDNIPVGPTGYSIPGAPRWDAYVKPTAQRIYATTPYEAFFDPNEEAVIGSDTMVWQYNFLFDEAEAFHQEEGQTYWLGVHHTFDLDNSGQANLDDLSLLKLAEPAAFGWKTADVHQYPPPYTGEHFMDHAVWIDVTTLGTDGHVVPEPAFWNDLTVFGVPQDLAFVITPEPGTMALLMGGALPLLLRPKRKLRSKSAEGGLSLGAVGILIRRRRR